MRWLLLLGSLSASAASYDRRADPHTFTVFMRESGWCWYQDPRAIVQGDQLFIGGVRGNGSGAAQVGVYDLSARKPLGTRVMREKFDRDDHNSPVFYARPNGSVLAIYARHNRDKTHFYRIAAADDPLSWSEEKRFTHDYSGAGNVTYMNLYYLAQESRLYNFFRGIKFNPSFISSTDHGKTWGQPTHFIASELNGRHRPYARYTSAGDDSVHVSFTDGHPRQYGNSIYYARFTAGAFYRADGSRIKSLKDGPLRPSEAERVYAGSGEPGRGASLSAPGSAWTSSIALDAQGNPHIGYTLYVSNTDHRYRVASWHDGAWIDREVAYAGNCLYDRESSYTGLITLDPADPRIAVISTDVDPQNGEFLGHHEIYRATIEPKDDVGQVRWQAITQDSPVDNLRPVILYHGDRRIILWNRGDFRTYTDYQLDTVGVIE